MLKALDDLGFQTPTPIQLLVIPRLLEERTDLIGLAQTGTGKTAAYGLPLLQQIDPAAEHPQALILAPTRELSLQITGELQRLAVHLGGLRIVTLYGGAPLAEQVRALRHGAHLIVATPGRLKDLMDRRKADLRHLHTVVLDEADEMLNMGFLPDLDYILSATPAEKKTWLFSATMSAEVQKIAGRYLHQPLELSSGARNTANESIDHQYIVLRPSDKYEALRRLLDYHGDFYGLVFVRTRREAKELAEKLTADGYPVDALHGDLSQGQREHVLDRFRSRRLSVLVATDVAARGLDISDLTHVLHFNIPEDLAFYTHRSGRTGRAGKAGTSIVLLTRRDLPQIRQIEKRSRTTFQQVNVPKGREIFRKLVGETLERIRSTPVTDDIRSLLPELYEELSNLSKEELIGRLAALALSDRAERYRLLAPDLEEQEKAAAPMKTVRLFINLGRVDGFDKGSFLRLVCERAGISGSAVGRIDIREINSHFDVEESLAPNVMAKLQDSLYGDRRLRVNPVQSGGPEGFRKPKKQGGRQPEKKFKKKLRK